MKMIILILMPLAFSCSLINRGDEETPHWIEGVMSGTESLKIKNGANVFYRRVLPLKEDSIQKTCDEVLGLVSRDLENDFSLDIKIPYTLDYLHYDPRLEICAVTISISSLISSKLSDISEIKKTYNNEILVLENKWNEAQKEKNKLETMNQQLANFIYENQALLDKYNFRVSEIQKAMSMLKERRRISSESAITDLKSNEFAKLIKESFKISYNRGAQSSACLRWFRASYQSYHAGTFVCWTTDEVHDGVIVGYCDSDSGPCYQRNP